MVRKYASFSKTGVFWWCKGEEGRSMEWGGRTLMFVKAGDLNWVLLISSVLIYDFFHFSPSRTWESFILLSHGRCLEKNVWVSLLDCIDLCHWISAFCSQVQILFCDGVCDAVLWTLSVGIKPVSIVYWKNYFYSWAQGYSLDVWNKVFDAFLCLMEVVLTLRYPIDLNLEIRIVWLCTLCLQSGGGACLWLP